MTHQPYDLAALDRRIAAWKERIANDNKPTLRQDYERDPVGTIARVAVCWGLGLPLLAVGSIMCVVIVLGLVFGPGVRVGP